ncbi:TonB-dependent receptor domain-containing protein [Providencia sneebia]|uniref:TonB-dependent receptor n=1 Tax=Providencia sneebia DSM 19967 TaxID=1141660 RepID=K8WEX4_9GAMM|nr:TonB-dependent receptor [Providencia sneebia]EKT56012.1 TonB-dependent receptor [Providencia sneebia DSM 19967]
MKLQTLKCSFLFISINYSFLSHATTSNGNINPEIDTISVYSSPLQSSPLRMTSPVSVLISDDLVSAKGASIAETLQNIPGFHASFFGGGSIHPVIRGMSGNRVKVMNNGSDLMDVSSIGADHAITSEPFLTQRIEVLKGPATLLYGGGSMGGAINVIDNKIPTTVPNKGYEGELNYQFDSVAKGNTGAAAITFGQDNLALRVEGVKRHQGDYLQPKAAQDDGTKRLQGSYQNGQSANIGASWIFDDGFIGLGYGEQHRRYGLPGHTHFEDEHAHDHHNDYDDSSHSGHHHGPSGPFPDEHHEHGIPYIVMDQKRWDLRGEKHSPFNGIESIRYSATHTDYHHNEKEGDEIATRFKNKGNELRFSLTHEKLWGWRGVLGSQFNQRDFSALGEEAYVPATNTKNHALFLLEEYQIGSLRYELGLRHEWQSIKNKSTHLSNNKDATSISAGLAWNFADDYSLNMSLSRSKRLPVAEELYADGPHAASRTIEKGDPNLGAETANNIDIGIMKISGNTQFNANAYYNRINNYIYGEITAAPLNNGYKPLQYVQQDAEFKGIEGNIDYFYSDDSYVGLSGDYVRATLLHNKGNVPRMPAYRISSYIKHTWTDNLTSQVRWDHFGRQNKVAKYETPTPSYNTISIGSEYTDHLDDNDYTIYAKVNNLFNSSTRDSTSYIKDEMLLPGRNIVIGLNFTF